MKNQGPPLCPSSHPAWPGTVAFGVVGGTVENPELIALEKLEPVTEELLAMAAPASPMEVFRFAGPCAGTGCRHFEAETFKCRLVARTVKFVPSATEKLPRCQIRPQCKWWQQEGKAACLRCPQVVSSNPANSDALRLAADPTLVEF